VIAKAVEDCSNTSYNTHFTEVDFSSYNNFSSNMRKFLGKLQVFVIKSYRSCNKTIWNWFNFTCVILHRVCTIYQQWLCEIFL